MTLWWIGAALLVAVVVPVVALILNRLLRPALQIGAYVDNITEDVAQFPGHIEAAVRELATTQRLVAQARPELQRYCQALERLL
jgi:antibiotic biosynthesis monooxygenase (ABM) superfamily enzyme